MTPRAAGAGIGIVRVRAVVGDGRAAILIAGNGRQEGSLRSLGVSSDKMGVLPIRVP